MSEFCRDCGASIPPREGEGTCPECDPTPVLYVRVTLLSFVQDGPDVTFTCAVDYTHGLTVPQVRKILARAAESLAPPLEVDTSPCPCCPGEPQYPCVCPEMFKCCPGCY